MAYATIEELAAEVRVRVTPENSATLQASLDAAATEIDHEVDRLPEDPIPEGDALAKKVNLARGQEWFKANDAAFGVIGFDQTGALEAPRDGFLRHAYALTPLKRNWGLA